MMGSDRAVANTAGRGRQEGVGHRSGGFCDPGSGIRRHSRCPRSTTASERRLPWTATRRMVAPKRRRTIGESSSKPARSVIKPGRKRKIPASPVSNPPLPATATARSSPDRTWERRSIWPRPARRRTRNPATELAKVSANAPAQPMIAATMMKAAISAAGSASKAMAMHLIATIPTFTRLRLAGPPRWSKL